MPAALRPADRAVIRQRLVEAISLPATLDDIDAGGGVTLPVRPAIDELCSLVALLVALLPGARQPGSRRRYLNSLADRIEAETVAIVRSMPAE